MSRLPVSGLAPVVVVLDTGRPGKVAVVLEGCVGPAAGAADKMLDGNDWEARLFWGVRWLFKSNRPSCK